MPRYDSFFMNQLMANRYTIQKNQAVKIIP